MNKEICEKTLFDLSDQEVSELIAFSVEGGFLKPILQLVEGTEPDPVFSFFVKKMNIFSYDTHFVLCKIDGVTVGASWATYDEKNHWYLIGTTVDPAHRKKGIGYHLYSKVMEWLKENDYSTFYHTWPFENSTRLNLTGQKSI